MTDHKCLINQAILTNKFEPMTPDLYEAFQGASENAVHYEKDEYLYILDVTDEGDLLAAVFGNCGEETYINLQGDE